MVDFVRVRGLAQLDRKLRRLDGVVQAKILRKAGRFAMQPVLKAARENAQGVRDSGAMAAAIAIGTRTGNAGTEFSMRIAVYPNPKARRALTLYNAARAADGRKPIQRLRHFHLVEFGSPNQPAAAVLRRAFATERQRILPRLRRQLRVEIAKVTR